MMFSMFSCRTMNAVLLVACFSSAFIGDYCATLAAVPYLDDEKEAIIDELANIIKDQNYRLRSSLEDESFDSRAARDQFADSKQTFTYDMDSDEPEINTGNQEIPFAVLPNDRRYYQPDFSSDLEPNRMPPNQVSHKYHKIERSKSSEVQDKYKLDHHGFVASKVTTENTSSSEVSMELPQSTYMHGMFGGNTKFSQEDYYFFAKAAGVGLAVLVVLLISSIACYRIKKNNKAAADIEYPAYGITGPNKDFSPTGDRRLAQSAQMYHYQHQKQQIIAMESNNSVKESRCGSVSDPDSDDDNEEGDYTVYECPGLAPAGEMEVKNPLFLDDNTPASPNPNVTVSVGGKNKTTENGIIPSVPVP